MLDVLGIYYHRSPQAGVDAGQLHTSVPAVHSGMGQSVVASEDCGNDPTRGDPAGEENQRYLARAVGSDLPGKKAGTGVG